MPLHTNGNNIGRWHPARIAMEIDGQVTRALRSGTTGMRAMGTVFLPMDEREKRKPEEYQKRLLHTFLLPAYDQAVVRIAAKPFQRQVALQGTDRLPEHLKLLERDSDRKRTNLTMLANRLFDHGLDTGIMHVLVDMPPAVRKDGEPMNLAEAKAADVRPYFALVHRDNLINWAWGDDGKLDHITVFEERSDTHPATMLPQRVQRLRFYSRDSWEVWERTLEVPTAQARRQVQTDGDLLKTAYEATQRSAADDDHPYTRVRHGVNELGEVPLRSVRLDEGGSDPFHASPCMIDLAWKNVEHWVSSSEQRWALRYGRFPILKMRGADREMLEQSLAVGAGAMLASTNDAFEAGYVEIGGGAIQAGERDLEKIEKQMAGLASAPLLIQTGNRTATEVGVEEMHTQSEAQTYAERLEWLLYECFALAGRWMDKDLPESFDIGVFRDFGLVARSEQDLRVLDSSRARGDISQETYLVELKKRGPIGQDLDVEEELERTERERQNAMAAAMPFAAEQDAPASEASEDAEAAEGGADGSVLGDITINEITLGIERLGRLGDIDALNILRRALAQKLGVPYSGDVDAGDLATEAATVLSAEEAAKEEGVPAGKPAAPPPPKGATPQGPKPPSKGAA